MSTSEPELSRWFWMHYASGGDRKDKRFLINRLQAALRPLNWAKIPHGFESYAYTHIGDDDEAAKSYVQIARTNIDGYQKPEPKGPIHFRSKSPAAKKKNEKTQDLPSSPSRPYNPAWGLTPAPVFQKLPPFVRVCVTLPGGLRGTPISGDVLVANLPRAERDLMCSWLKKRNEKSDCEVITWCIFSDDEKSPGPGRPPAKQPLFVGNEALKIPEFRREALLKAVCRVNAIYRSEINRSWAPQPTQNDIKHIREQLVAAGVKGTTNADGTFAWSVRVMNEDVRLLLDKANALRRANIEITE